MKTTKSNRRNFLLAAGLGSAAAAAAVVTATQKAKPVADAAAGQASGASGYRDSEHIQKYYKTAKV